MRSGEVRVLLLVTLASGCRAEAAPEAQLAFAARDSAGVRIVEHASFDGLPLRMTADPPEVAIGTSLDDETRQLDRVSGGAVLSNGRIALLNSGSSEVRFYDGVGALVASQGSAGDGPGEYRAPFFLYRMGGDSLLVWDGALRRGTVVSPDASVARSVTLDGANLGLTAGVFASGELLVLERDPLLDPSRLSTLVREEQHDRLYSAEGRRLAELGDRSGGTMMLFQGGRPLTGPPDMKSAIDLAPAPFASSTQRAVAGDGYWVSEQREPQVSFVDRSGAPRTLVRWQRAPRVVGDADKEAYLASRIEAARTEEVRTALRSTELEAFQFPASFPSHGALVAATDGALWMADYRRPSETGPARWTVIGDDGVARERVELPEGSTLLWASGDRVLLRLEDQLGVQRVELRGLAPAQAVAP